MNVFVTGGAGYVGCSLIQHLLRRDNVERVTVFDNRTCRNDQFFLQSLSNNSKLKFVEGDILDNRKLEKELDGIDVVYHLAAKVSEPENDIDSHYFEQTNHWGTSILSDVIVKKGVPKVVYSSSMYIYGHHDEYITKDTNPEPNSFYGASKLRGEEQLLRLKDNVDVYVFRIANVFGYNECINFNVLINKLLFDANYKNKVTIYGDGSQMRAFINVDQLAKLLAQVIDNSINPGIHNLVELNLSINDLYNELERLYPGLEYFYVNRHIKMKTIKIEVPPFISSDKDSALQKFRNDLTDIKVKLI